MTSLLMPLHVTPDTERLPAAGARALERLLARVGVAVDLEARGPAEGLAAGGAEVAVLRRGAVDGLLRGADVVVVFPGV